MAWYSSTEEQEHNAIIAKGVKEILDDFGDNKTAIINTLVGEIRNSYRDGFRRGLNRSKEVINELLK